MSAKQTKVLFVACALLLSVLLFIAPKTANDSQKKASRDQNTETVSENNTANVEVYLKLALKNLEPKRAKELDQYQKGNKTDSLISFWDRSRRPDLAAHFTEEIAKRSPSAQAWIKAGERYFYAVQFTQDQTEIPLLYKCALRCYSKGLKMDPKNVDAKVMLASCYVEGTSDPMKGISLLREVEKTDSNNIKLQLNFAFFSMKSGQLDKAIQRFEKVLRIDSNYIEAYLHIADANEQRGKTELTIKALEKYGAKTGDPTAKAEIYKYIEQLKKR